MKLSRDYFMLHDHRVGQTVRSLESTVGSPSNVQMLKDTDSTFQFFNSVTESYFSNIYCFNIWYSEWVTVALPRAMHLKNIFVFSEQKSRRQQIGKNKEKIIMCLEFICTSVLMWKGGSISSTLSSLSCLMILRVLLQIALTLFFLLTALLYYPSTSVQMCMSAVVSALFQLRHLCFLRLCVPVVFSC